MESLRACGLVSGARRLAAACARSMRFRQAKAGSRWVAPSEAGPSSGARALAAHSDPGTCPVTAVPAPHGPCALMVDDGCLAQGKFATITLDILQDSKSELFINAAVLVDTFLTRQSLIQEIS